MSSYEIIAASVIVTFTFGIVGYFGWQEISNLRRIPTSPVSNDERRRTRFRAWRRLFCCFLLLLIAGLLVGNYFVDQSRVRIMEPGEETGVTMNEEQRQFWQFYSYYWIVICLLLLAVILIVGYDLWSLRRWGLNEQRRLNRDHREMLEHEVATYLRQRNGHKD
jgi:hypothetical protein